MTDEEQEAVNRLYHSAEKVAFLFKDRWPTE